MAREIMHRLAIHAEVIRQEDTRILRPKEAAQAVLVQRVVDQPLEAAVRLGGQDGMQVVLINDAPRIGRKRHLRSVKQIGILLARLRDHGRAAALDHRFADMMYSRMFC